MTKEKVLGIRVSGDLAHFRKVHISTDVRTYTTPPRTTVSGLLGAIAGLPRKGETRYSKVFEPDSSKIFLKPELKISRKVTENKNVMYKQNINKNMIRMKNKGSKPMNVAKIDEFPDELVRNQIRFEFIMNPSYKIFFNTSNTKIYKKLRKLIGEKGERADSIYTPSLGLSELLCTVESLGEKDIEKCKTDVAEGVVDMSNNPIKSSTDLDYIRERKQRHLDSNDRVVSEYGDYIVERNKKPVKLSEKVEAHKIDNEGAMIQL